MVIFPDIEPLLVAHLSETLAASSEPYAQDVRVGTIKRSTGELPSREVIITAAYTTTLTDVTRAATATIDVYAGTYEDASSLALLVAAIVVQIPRTHIKRAIVTLGPVRLNESSQAERRAISVELTVKGEDA